MTLREYFVMFDNRKDFESDEIFDSMILFEKFFLCKWKMENKYPFSLICKTADLRV